MKPAGGIGEGARRAVVGAAAGGWGEARRAAGHLLDSEVGDSALAVGQVVELLPRVPRREAP